MTTRRLIILTAAVGWGCYTWGHKVGHDRAQGLRPYYGKMFRE